MLCKLQGNAEIRHAGLQATPGPSDQLSQEKLCRKKLHPVAFFAAGLLNWLGAGRNARTCAMLKSWLDDHSLQLIPTSLPQLAIMPCVLRLCIGTAAHARHACYHYEKGGRLGVRRWLLFSSSTHVHQSLDALRNLLVLVGCWPQDRSRFDFPAIANFASHCYLFSLTLRLTLNCFASALFSGQFESLPPLQCLSNFSSSSVLLQESLVDGLDKHFSWGWSKYEACSGLRLHLQDEKYTGSMPAVPPPRQAVSAHRQPCAPIFTMSLRPAVCWPECELCVR